MVHLIIIGVRQLSHIHQDAHILNKIVKLNLAVYKKGILGHD